MSKFKFVMVSGNSKLGPIPSTITSSDTCPSTCPFNNGGGCYAATGPLSWFWRGVDKGYGTTSSFKEFLRLITTIPPGNLWRHNAAGDLPGLNHKIDGRMVAGIVKANKGRKGFTYTHKPVLHRPSVERSTVLNNRRIIKKANDAGFTINLSANNLKQADELVNLGIAPVAVVIPDNVEVDAKIKTPNGVKVKLCPHYTEGTLCRDCKLCQKVNRKYIIGFPAHGILKKKVSLIAMK
jgi:hypothetical protein